MSPRRSNQRGASPRLALLTAALFFVAAVAPLFLTGGPYTPAGWGPLSALAQGDPLQALSEEYAQLESQGLKENFHRQLSYAMLQEYLPPGARMTSGYRSPQKQLDLIMRMARANGIPTSSQPEVSDESSWRPALMALRAKGFIIAAPTTTPHASDEAVFDLSGADLGAIQEGLRRAERAGMVKFKTILFEQQNNAVHVEVESISPKALNALGRRRPTSGGGGAGPSPASEADQRRSMIAQLQSLHDGEPDPAKKIDYDRSLKNLLDPVADQERSQALDAEIAQHRQEAQLLTQDTQKQQALERVSQALREERYEDAERAAASLAKKYPDIPRVNSVLRQIRTRRLVSEATAALYSSAEPGCGECGQADELFREALELSPNLEGAQFIREDIDACLSRCRTRRLPLLVLFVFIFAVAVSGAFFLLRSGNLFARAAAPAGGPRQGPFPTQGGRASAWVLEGVEGPCRGQVFPVDKGEIIIGSKAPPEGVADIVILDPQKKVSRRHCTIVQDGTRFYLIDYSTNGTKLNDEPVAKGVPVEFRSGDRITLADSAVLTLRPA